MVCRTRWMVGSTTVIDDLTADETGAVLRANADKTEQAGRPAAESLDALRGGGFLALRTPREYGGAWAGVEAVARRLTDLGRACPSSAWVTGTCLTAKNIAVACRMRSRDPFGDPDALCCGSGIPAGRGEPGPDGVRISGRWPIVSGCEDAAWAVLGLMVEGVFSFAVIPVTDLVIEQTWYVAGMRGTGSHTVVAQDVLVPAERVAPAPPFTTADLMLYSMTVLGPVVGATLGALDAVRAMFASDRKPLTTRTRGWASPRVPDSGWRRRRGWFAGQRPPCSRSPTRSTRPMCPKRTALVCTWISPMPPVTAAARWNGCSTCTARAVSPRPTCCSGTGATSPWAAGIPTSTRTSRSSGTAAPWPADVSAADRPRRRRQADGPSLTASVYRLPTPLQ
jgi:hypothetical protein